MNLSESIGSGTSQSPSSEPRLKSLIILCLNFFLSVERSGVDDLISLIDFLNIFEVVK